MSEPSEPPRPRIRVTLKPEDAASQAGTELLNLCTTITEDGSLLDDEIAQLRDWLQENQHAPIPAIAFLCELVTRVLADGKVTSKERGELHKALERVLPKELRELVTKRRRDTEFASWKEQLKNQPDETFDFMVAGVLHERRSELVRKYVRVDSRIFFVREPLNTYSRNAVKVVLQNGAVIGYVPEEDAAVIAPLLDSGHKQKAWVKKVLEGRKAPFPVIVADLYDAARDVPEARVISAADVSPPPAERTRSGCGCLSFSSAVLAALMLMVLLLAQ